MRRESKEHYRLEILHYHPVVVVPAKGFRVQDSVFFMAVYQIGVSHRRFHATLPEARYSDYPYRCGCHHADFGRVHVVIGHIADVGFI